MTYVYTNGSEETVSGYLDVSTGDNEEVGAFFFVSPNLNVGDRVYPEGFFGNTINQTLQREYAGMVREVLLDCSSFEFEYTPTVDGRSVLRVINSQINYYFDRQTGVCLEKYEESCH